MCMLYVFYSSYFTLIYVIFSNDFNLALNATWHQRLLVKIATDKLHLSSSDDRIILILPLVWVYPVLYVDIVDIVCR